MIKVLKKLEIEENIAEHNEDCTWQNYNQHHTEWGCHKAFPLKLERWQGNLLSSFLFNKVFENCSAIRKEKEIKVIRVGKEEINKIPWNKPNQGSERPLQWKVKEHEQRNWRTHRKMKSHVHVLKELIILPKVIYILNSICQLSAVILLISSNEQGTTGLWINRTE